MNKRKLSHRFYNASQKVNDKQYNFIQGIELVKNIASAKFIETIEAHILLGIDPKYADQQLRSTVILPKGTGKDIKIAVIAKPDKELEAAAAGANIIAVEHIIEQVQQDCYDFDKLIATPDVMPMIAKLGRILGPKGLMPSPKAGTVTWDIANAIREFKSGKLEYKVDKTGIVHIPFGKVSFSANDLAINLCAIQESIERNRPSGAKGKYWRKIHICSTMGPSVSINILSLFSRAI